MAGAMWNGLGISVAGLRLDFYEMGGGMMVHSFHKHDWVTDGGQHPDRVRLKDTVSSAGQENAGTL